MVSRFKGVIYCWNAKKKQVLYTVSHTIMARLSTDARCNLNSMIRIDCHEHSTRPLNNHPINNAMEVMLFVRVDYFRKKFLFLGPVTSALKKKFVNRKSTLLTRLLFIGNLQCFMQANRGSDHTLRVHFFARSLVNK